MKLLNVLLLLFLIYSNSEAIQYLTGEKSGDLDVGEYIVTGTIYVLQGQTFRIVPGTKIYFEQFSGIVVLGSLYCEGTIDSPVVLTSKRESPERGPDEKPEAFDWNGIEASANAKLLSIVNTKIRNCTMGLNIKSTSTKIKLERVEFYNNGYTSISRDGKMVVVQPEVPFGITWNLNEDIPEERLVIRQGNEDNFTQKKSENKIRPKTANIDNKEKSRIKLAFRLGCSALGVGGATVFIVSSIMNSQYKEKYVSAKDPSDAERYENRFNKSRNGQITGGILTAVGVLGFGVTFFF
jgi:hypothetical protein